MHRKDIDYASVFYSQLNLLNDLEYEVVTKYDQARLRIRNGGKIAPDRYTHGNSILNKN